MSKDYSVRFIDEVGRIVLPAELRNALDLEIKTPIEIHLSKAENEIIIKKHKLSCIFCGETENSYSI